MSWLMATYNVLAPSYVRSEWCPHTHPGLLDAGRRIPALADHLAHLDCDAFCLQEVEREVFSVLEAQLTPLGYAGDYCPKGSGKPDGCAAFYRTGRLTLVGRRRLEFEDGTGSHHRSGHVAQVLVLAVEGRLLAVANTHLKWDAAGVYGCRQVRELLAGRSDVGSDSSGWVICGDLNAASDSDVVRILLQAGFVASHSADAGGTCNSNRRAKMIDFIFHDDSLVLKPLPLPVVDDDTPLPGPGQPSDHVAVLARCDWGSK